MISNLMFEAATGRKPVQDDLERCNCDKADTQGHMGCGWNYEHDCPAFERATSPEFQKDRDVATVIKQMLDALPAGVEIGLQAEFKKLLEDIPYTAPEARGRFYHLAYSLLTDHIPKPSTDVHFNVLGIFTRHKPETMKKYFELCASGAKEHV